MEIVLNEPNQPERIEQDREILSKVERGGKRGKKASATQAGKLSEKRNVERPETVGTKGM